MWMLIPVGILVWFLYQRYRYRHEVVIQRGENRADTEAFDQAQGYYDYYGNLRPTQETYVHPNIALWDWLKGNPCATELYEEDYEVQSGVVIHGGRYTGRTK